MKKMIVKGIAFLLAIGFIFLPFWVGSVIEEKLGRYWVADCWWSIPFVAVGFLLCFCFALCLVFLPENSKRNMERE